MTYSLGQSSSSSYLLGSCFLTSVFLINRLPTSSLNFDIPFVKLYKQQPDFHFLRVFGCACFPLLRPYNQNKLQFRSQECIFLGYSPAHKGYKCLSAEGIIYISKDVVFNESKFPYPSLFSSTSSSHSSLESQFPTTTIPTVSVPQPQAPIPIVDYSSTHMSNSQSNQSAPTSPSEIHPVPNTTSIASTNSSSPNSDLQVSQPEHSYSSHCSKHTSNAN